MCNPSIALNTPSRDPKYRGNVVKDLANGRYS